MWNHQKSIISPLSMNEWVVYNKFVTIFIYIFYFLHLGRFFVVAVKKLCFCGRATLRFRVTRRLIGVRGGRLNLNWRLSSRDTSSSQDAGIFYDPHPWIPMLIDFVTSRRCSAHRRLTLSAQTLNWNDAMNIHSHIFSAC